MRIQELTSIPSWNALSAVRNVSVRLASFVLVASAVQCTNVARADVWVERMLETREHDFGKLDCGTEAAWRFPVTNVYKHRISLVGVRSSCGCTTASLENNELDPGQIGFIAAKFNTRLNPGAHNATLTLQTSWNDNGAVRTGEATLKVFGTVRGNITVEPDEITFANVPHGKSNEQKLHVSAEHNPTWRVKTVQCSCENLQVELPVPLTSTQQVVYEMPVRLSKRTPPGAVSEQLLLVTNDVAAPQIPVHISGRVVPEIWTSPESLFLGEVTSGGNVLKKVIVRSNEPSQIKSIESNSQHFQFKTDETRSTRHIIEVTFHGQEVGESKELISITSDAGQTAKVTAYSTVVPSSRR